MIPFRKAHRVPDPRQRRRVQRRRQPGRLLRPGDGRGDGDGRLSDRRPDCGARAGDGREAVLQALPARRRDRARIWPRCTRTAARACARRWCSTTARTRPRRGSSRATSTGTRFSAAGVRWFHSGGIFAALSATTGELIIEGMKAAKAAGAVTSLRSELSREAVEHLGRPRDARWR